MRLEEEVQEDKEPHHHINKGIYYQHELPLFMLTLITWLKWHLLITPPISRSALFGKGLLWQSTNLYLRSGDLCTASFKAIYIYAEVEGVREGEAYIYIHTHYVKLLCI